MLLAQSTKLADALSVAFNTPSGVPYDEVNAEMTGPGKPGFDMANATNYLAQAGTLILEWSRLSNLTNNPKYANLAKRAELKLNTATGRPGIMVEPMPGLVGNEVFVGDGTFKNGGGSWGGGSDSYYEYLLKGWMYDAHNYNRFLRNKWAKAVDSSRKYLRSYPFPDPPRFPYARPPFFDVQKILNKLYPGAGQFLNLFRIGYTPKYKPRPALMQAWNSDKTIINASQHLACFDGGNILLGAQVMYESIHTPRSYGKWGANDLDDIYHFGLDLVEGCHYVYSHTATGIGPDFFSWRGTDTINLKTPFFSTPEPMDKAYGLRPEVIESYYYAFRVTGDPIYQDWAWDAFVAFEKFCKTEFGYASIKDVNLWLPPATDVEETKKRIKENWLDQQESFWLAETLKYLYLIFVDVSLTPTMIACTNAVLTMHRTMKTGRYLEVMDFPHCPISLTRSRCPRTLDGLVNRTSTCTTRKRIHSRSLDRNCKYRSCVDRRPMANLYHISERVRKHSRISGTRPREPWSAVEL